MSVLADKSIAEFCAKREMVLPYYPEDVQPASIDMRLGNEFIVFDKHEGLFLDLDGVHDRSARKIVKDGGKGFILHPGDFVLGVTESRVDIPHFLMGRIEGKSSIGRLGIMVHVTAGFIDPGFKGPITLEICNLRSIPIILRPGKAICQISFHMMDSMPLKPYNGRYQDATGVEASLYGKERCICEDARTIDCPQHGDIDI